MNFGITFAKVKNESSIEKSKLKPFIFIITWFFNNMKKKIYGNNYIFERKTDCSQNISHKHSNQIWEKLSFLMMIIMQNHIIKWLYKILDLILNQIFSKNVNFTLYS